MILFRQSGLDPLTAAAAVGSAHTFRRAGTPCDVPTHSFETYPSLCLSSLYWARRAAHAMRPDDLALTHFPFDDYPCPSACV